MQGSIKRRHDGPAGTPSHDAIAAEAYRLWEAAGCPVGCDESFWDLAEQNLQSTVTTRPAMPPADRVPQTGRYIAIHA